MKLLCDVCENAAASLICCADEAALCASCDSRIHAANKLASKHQRIPLLSEPSDPVVCDICQERPSFFFCVEDRALLCRECDVSIHSANALAAKHKRLLLTCLQVGDASSSSRLSRETSASAMSLEQVDAVPTPLSSPAVAVTKPPVNQAPARTAWDSPAVAVKKLPGNQAPAHYSSDGGGICTKSVEKRTSKKQAVVNAKDSGVQSNEGVPKMPKNKTSAPAAMNAKLLRSYLTNKKGMLSSLDGSQHRMEAMDNSNTNPTTMISIQRISAGKVPFVAPVLSTLRAALMQEGISSHGSISKNASIDNNKDGIGEITDNNSNLGAMVEFDDYPPVESENVSDYLVSGIPGWRIDELLTDLVGVCESGSSLSPPKESNTPGFGIHEDPPWYADLDAMEDLGTSSSQEEGVALVPETPSPPTASGLVTSRGKSTCPAAQPWAFDYLFTDPHHSNEFSVVPDIDGRRSSPLSTASPTRDNYRKRRKFWLDD